MSGAELAYRYLAPSAVRRREDGSDVLLSTSGGVTDAGPAVHPYFFSGLLTEPAVAAAGCWHAPRWRGPGTSSMTFEHLHPAPKPMARPSVS